MRPHPLSLLGLLTAILLAMPAAPVRAQPARQLDYRLEGVVVLRSGWRIETYRRFVRGAPVIGAVRRVRTSPGGRVEILEGPERPVAPTGPSIGTGAEAAARARARTGRSGGARARRAAFVQGGRIVLGWEVTLDADDPAESLRAFVDERDLGVALAFHPASPALGRIYDPDPIGAMGRTVDVELEGLTSAAQLTGERVRAASCDPAGAECTLRQFATPDAAGDFLFDPEEPAFDDPFAEVNAYAHAARAAAYFEDVHGLTWACCGTSAPLDVVVNYSPTPGEPYGFSLFAPSECDVDRCGSILVGQGEDRDLAYDGDVLYHEHVHAIIDERADNLGYVADALGVHYEPSAVKEGTADYFTAAIGGDPRIAEYLAGLGTRPFVDALRSIDNEARCPDDLFGEAHEDGTIWGGALWSIREAVGASVDELVMATILSLGEQPTFAEASEVLIATARTMASEGGLEGSAVEVVEAEIAARGLGECERIVSLDDGTPREGFSGRFFPTGSFGRVAPIHYRVSVPEDFARLEVGLEPVSGASELTLLVRVRDPVEVDGAGEITADGRLSPTEGRIVLDPSTSPAPQPGETLYLAVMTDDLEEQTGVYQIAATVERGGGGCACETAAPPGLGGAWAVVFFFLVSGTIRGFARK